MNFKKVLAMALAAVLLVALSVGATVAWLTDEAEDKLNVFTVGDIDISLKEEVGTEGAANVVEREEGTEGADYSSIMPGDKLIKVPTVKNEGVNPAYVAVTVTINNADLINLAIDEVYEARGYTAAEIQAIYDLIFDGWGIRYDKVDDNGEALGMRLTNQLPTDEKLLHVDSIKTTIVDNDTYFFGYNNWFQSDFEKANAANGVYGSYPVSSSYYYDAEATEDYQLKYTYYLYLEGGQEFTLFNGLNVPLDFNREQLRMFSELEILIEAAAIQADNTESPQQAFTALKGEI